MQGIADRACVEIPDPPDASELVQWAQERLSRRDFPPSLTSPWLRISDCERFLASTLAQAAGRGWVRGSALHLLRRYKAALRLSAIERNVAGDD